MSEGQDIRERYAERIKKFATELSEDFLKNEPDLINRFVSFDAEVQQVLIEVGKQTMDTVGNSIENEIKKKP